MRSLTGKLVNPHLFWDEVQKALLLISRLNDDKMMLGLVESYSRQVTYCINNSSTDRKLELFACQALYAAWSALSKRAAEYQAAGWELNEFWLQRLHCANAHMFERLFWQLDQKNMNLLELTLPRIYANVAQVVSADRPNSNIVLDLNEITKQIRYENFI